MRNRRKLKNYKELRQILSTNFDLENAEEVGCGNFAEVFKVLDKRDQKIKALRRVSKSQQQLNDLIKQREINQQLKLKIQHQNILTTLEIFEDQKQIVYLTQFCQGGSLWDALNQIKGKKFPEKDSLLIVHQIAIGIICLQGVQQLHQVGITHRDLKLQNILLTQPYKIGSNITIKIADFGLSTNKTIMKTIAGTKQYISPQQVRGEKYVKAVDIWALGIILDELIHGQPFFSGQKTKQVFHDILKSNQVQTEQYSIRLQKIKAPTKSLLQKMLRKKPDQRPTIKQVIKELDDCIQTCDFYDKNKTIKKKIITQDSKSDLSQKMDFHSPKNIKEIWTNSNKSKDVWSTPCLSVSQPIQQNLQPINTLIKEIFQQGSKIKESLTINKQIDFSKINDCINRKNIKASKWIKERRKAFNDDFQNLKRNFQFLNVYGEQGQQGWREGFKQSLKAYDSHIEQSLKQIMQVQQVQINL